MSDQTIKTNQCLEKGSISDMEFSITTDHRPRLLQGMVDTALRAGQEIWDIYQEDFEVFTKGDASPVTVADARAEAVILRAIASLAPHTPVVAEEEAASGRIPDVGNEFFLIDPLDGTKEFIQRRSDFTVNIGLVQGGFPTLGVVYAPARSRLYVGDVLLNEAWSSHQPPKKSGEATNIEALRVRPVPLTGLTAVASKSHNTPETDAYLARYDVKERISVGSSLKLCLVASGEADLYPRLAPTCEWDTAAGHAVLTAAGGNVYALNGSLLTYGKPKFFNPGFIATGSFAPYPADAA